MEEPAAETRAYEVYGPAWVREDIRGADLPAAQKSKYGASFVDDSAFFEGSICTRFTQLVPECYSVVAIDNPNCGKARLHAVNIDRSALTDLREHISLDLEAGHPYFADLHPGAVHWFMSDTRALDFILQLIGPISFEPAACLAAVPADNE